MDPVITEFKKEGRRASRVIVYLDGGVWRTLDAETIVRERLATGQRLSPARQAEVLAADEAVRARKAAGIHAAKTPKTRRELERFLEDKGFGPEARRRALEGLAEIGVADDEKAAGRIVRGRRRGGGVGPARLEAELRGRGVAGETAARKVEEAFAGTDLADECAALARKSAARYEPLTDPAQRRKLAAFLMRRGYGEEHVQAAVAQLLSARGINEDEPF